MDRKEWTGLHEEKDRAAQRKIPVVAVVGPTASGKSRLAVELALRRGGEIISADSMQIYRGMAIGTAQPSPEEMQGVPHHLIGFADPCEPFSVADYVAVASSCIKEVDRRGKLPVLAGGTGLYVRSLLHHIQFAEEGRDDALRKELLQRADRDGPECLLEELRGFDPESASRLHPNNIGRVVRAIEVYRVTGKTMTEQIAGSQKTPSPYRTCMIGLDFKERDKLYARINQRVDRMLENGLEREAFRILSGHTGTAGQAIGYKEFLPCFDGAQTLQETAERIKQNSRRYAKRQLTWFRRDEEIHWIFVDRHKDFSSLLNEALMVVDEGLFSETG